MPITINSQTYYRTHEVCAISGIGKTTLFRWIKEGVVKEAENRDRRGWRLFTEADVRKIQNEANHIKQATCLSR